jgi:hypothetical protein
MDTTSSSKTVYLTLLSVRTLVFLAVDEERILRGRKSCRVSVQNFNMLVTSRGMRDDLVLNEGLLSALPSEGREL